MRRSPEMDIYAELCEWVGFTEADEHRLRALWPAVSTRIEPIVDRFYARILANPNARMVFRDEAQIVRQKRTLRLWIEELLVGPRDVMYVAHRERVGQVHVEVGLPARYMFAAMNVIREHLCEIARETMPPEVAVGVCRAVDRAADIDLAIMTGTYVEQREERQLATLQDLIVSHLPVTVLLLDAAGTVTAATRPGTRLFGDLQVLNRHYAHALPTGLVEAAQLPEHVDRALATNREIVLSRVDAMIDGQERNFRINLVPLDHPQARMLVHLEELTDTIATEARVRRTESLAHLGALSAAVAHELRNPLAGISGAIQVISRSLPADDRRKPIMEKVEAQVRRLDLLVTDLLQFARPIEVRTTELSLDELVRAVIEPLQKEHPAVELHCVGRGRAAADPQLLHQVLLNLVLNAIQAIRGEAREEGTGEVWVRVHPGGVDVEDSGPGIPLENAEKIFDAFFTTRARGTGLGLAICRKLVSAMGGDISLDQEPGRGARFSIRLPAA